MKTLFSCFWCFFNAGKKQTNLCPKEIYEASWNTTTPYIPNVKYGKVIKVYDGDTITIAGKPFENSSVHRFSVRLNGIDAPEIKTTDKNEKKHAIVAREALKIKVMDKIISLQNVSYDKYGRLLADVYLREENISDWLLQCNYVVKYDGGTKTKPKEWFE